MELAERVLAGEERAIARAITVVEDESAEAAALVRALFGHTGDARVIGVTGPPGAGKSTLVDAMTAAWRRDGTSVGILAVDPTSPYTGGAILGDRIRMQAHAGDRGVFVRSMATRGHLGGVARATGDAALVLAASGKDRVVIETVGVGQGEVEVVRTADVSIVVTIPGAGDDVQTLKAGIMEIADIFVVNKADREGADRTAAEIAAATSLVDVAPGGWRPPVLQTQAPTGKGVDELLATLRRFADTGGDSPARRQARARHRLFDLLTRRCHAKLVGSEERRAAVAAAVTSIADGDVDPYTAADTLLRGMGWE